MNLNRKWAWCRHCHTVLGPEGEPCARCGNVFVHYEPVAQNGEGLLVASVGGVLLLAIAIIAWCLA